MQAVGSFPFGQPVLPVLQQDRSVKRVFVLGVYSSAVHARWIGPDGRQLIGAVGVASEPAIFWRGDTAEAQQIIASIKLPEGAGRLAPASAQLNGPSGVALDDCFLAPMGVTREDAWLCDLVPHSCMNPGQAKALAREYEPRASEFGLPAVDWPDLPSELCSDSRRQEICDEIAQAEPEVLVTLGDEPLRWFTSQYGSKRRLSDYGRDLADYGRLHPLVINGRKLELLPLVHPRQAAALGTHSGDWFALHGAWMAANSETAA